MSLIRVASKAVGAIQIPYVRIMPGGLIPSDLAKVLDEIRQQSQVDSAAVFWPSPHSGWGISITMPSGIKSGAAPGDWFVFFEDRVEVFGPEMISVYFETNPPEPQTVSSLSMEPEGRFVPATVPKVSKHYHTEDGGFEAIQFRAFEQAREAGVAMEWAHSHAYLIQYVIGWSLRSGQQVSFHPYAVHVHDESRSYIIEDGDFIAFINGRMYGLDCSLVDSLFNLVPN